jgi:hypothetical protein
MIENTASIPSRFFPERGTPITGRANNAAHIPGRAAAIPAPAIITLIPRSSAPLVHSISSSGSRCAEMIVISYSIPNSSSITAALLITLRSESLPIIIPTFGIIFILSYKFDK